jgi:hypothetical protein
MSMIYIPMRSCLPPELPGGGNFSFLHAPFRHYMGTGHSALNTSTRKEIIMSLGKWIRPVIVVMLFGAFLTGQSKSAMAEEDRSESAISP